MSKPETAPKVTKRMIDFLCWMQEQGKISMWPYEWSAMQNKASKEGLIEAAGREPGRILAFTLYQLSEKGRYILEHI
jgi:hypothetical protein